MLSVCTFWLVRTHRRTEQVNSLRIVFLHSWSVREDIFDQINSCILLSYFTMTKIFVRLYNITFWHISAIKSRITTSRVYFHDRQGGALGTSNIWEHSVLHKTNRSVSEYTFPWSAMTTSEWSWQNLLDRLIILFIN